MGNGRTALLRLGLGYLGFVSLGLPDGLLGVAGPSIRAEFGVPVEAFGALLVAFTAGYVGSSFTSGWLLARMSVGALLALSCLATGASLLGWAVSPSFELLTALAVLAGAGAGAIDAGINTYVATHHGARTLNWLHAFYGLGATSGPALMTAALMAGDPWQTGYAQVGAAQVALAATFAATVRVWPRATMASQGSPAGPAASAASTLRLGRAWLAIAVFFLYTGLELATGVWTYSFLTEARGVSLETAGLSVSLFWGGLMAGRLVLGAVVARTGVDALLGTAIAGVGAGALLLALDLGAVVASAAVAAIGFAMGPIFPSLVASTPTRLGAAHTANAVGFQIAAAALGQALVPSAIGVLAGATGLGSFAPALFAAALALAALHGLLSRAASPLPAARLRAATE